MNFYTKQHKYYCGIDLHAKTMYVCVMDVEGKVLLHRNIRNDAEYFLKILEPYREDVVVAVECVFSWYWVADLCADEDIEFVLGHALYMRAIHGGKAKNDKVDSLKIAALTRGGMLPTAFVYPKRMRSARDLMRRRTHLCRMRAELVAHTQLCRLQYNLPAFEREIRHRHGGVREGIVEHFEDPFVKKSVATNVELIDYIDSVLKRLELDILKAARGHDPDALRILQTIPGVGKILSLTILYEICDIRRFPRVQDYLSYCRLVKCRKEVCRERLRFKWKEDWKCSLKMGIQRVLCDVPQGKQAGKELCGEAKEREGKRQSLIHSLSSPWESELFHAFKE